MEKTAALATGGRHAVVHATRWARIAVTIGLEHAGLRWQQLGIQARHAIELAIARGPRGRAGIARPILRTRLGHGLMLPMRGARVPRLGVPPIAMRGAAGIRAGILGIFGSAARGLAGLGPVGIFGMRYFPSFLSVLARFA